MGGVEPQVYQQDRL